MKNKYFFILFIFVFTFANSQTKLDSLYSVWEDKTQTDSSRVEAFKRYIWKGYIFSQPDSALVLADKLYKFSYNRNYNLGMAIAFDLQGVGNSMIGDYTNAIIFNKRSLKIFQEIGDKNGIEVSLGNVGIGYKLQGNYPQALDYHKRSLKISQEIGNKKGIAFQLVNIGNIYTNQANKHEALDYFQRGLKIHEEIGNKRGIAISLNNIGLIYNYHGIYTQALDYFQRSLKIQEEIENNLGIANAFNNIGLNHYELGNYSQALDYYQRSIKLKKEFGDKNGIAQSQGNIGHVYLKLSDFSKAIENCEKGLELATLIQSIQSQRRSCVCLYEAYKALENGNKALGFHEQMLVLNDSLQSEETAKKLQQMEFEKQNLADSLVQVEKDLKVEMVHQSEVRKKDKNKNLALGAGIFFLLLSSGFYGRWRYVKKSKAIIEKEKDRSENLLLNILPSEIAEELKAKGSADARDFDLVTVLFTDFKGFTKASEKLTAKELIAEINHCFMAFDHICEKYGIEKIKTIGDAYMAVGGLPIPTDDSIKQTILAALEMQSFITQRIAEKQAKNEVPFEMRLGLHTGPVVAGIVGVKKFQYDIWGDTVNTASRMESSGEIGKVNISQDTYNHIKDDPQFSFVSRGKIQAKSKGELEMYFVSMQS